MRQGPDLLQSLIKYFQAQLRLVPNSFFSFSSLCCCSWSSTLTFSLKFCGFGSFYNLLILLLTCYIRHFLYNWVVFAVQTCDVLVCWDQAVECHHDSTNVVFLVQFLSGWTESGWESHSLYREAGRICSYGEFPVPDYLPSVRVFIIKKTLVIPCLYTVLLFSHFRQNVSQLCSQKIKLKTSPIFTLSPLHTFFLQPLWLVPSQQILHLFPLSGESFGNLDVMEALEVFLVLHGQSGDLFRRARPQPLRRKFT